MGRRYQNIIWNFIVIINISFFIGLLFPSISEPEEIIITYRSPESKEDKRYDYDNSLLKLALEKTKQEYGDYKLIPSMSMNFARAITSVNENKFKNFFVKLSYLDSFSEEMNLAYVPFPVDLGIVGYRVCFTCPEVKEKISEVRNLSDLKKFTYGQGTGWADTEILRYNDFKVIEIPMYESLFKMVADNRLDLFCRGVNEFLSEYNAYKHIEGLTYDTSISIAYPMPRFFYTHKSCKKALERVGKGIIMAYNDGSLKELWLKKYQKSIDFAQLDKRTIYYLENPFLKKLDFDFQKYFYYPLKNTKAVGRMIEK